MSQNKDLHKWERLVALSLAAVVIITLIVYVFFLPSRTDSTTAGLIKYFAALVSGFSAYLFAGNLELEGKIPLGKLGVRASGAFATFFAVLVLFYWGIPEPSNEPPPSPPEEDVDVSQNISLGERLLIKSITSEDKTEGLRAFGLNEFSTAINFFEKSLERNPNDPETLLYLNNARAELAKQINGTETLKIAASVPISGEQGVAEGILRGIAQAQNEVNSTQEGIDGRKLQVLLADDQGDKGTATSLAKNFTNDASILAVIGGFSSSLAKATADIYDGKLVFISPTATSVELSNYSPYFFRTPPSDAIAAQQLSEYASDIFRVENVAIAYDIGNPYSESLKREFEVSLGKDAVHTCDLGKDGFNAERDCINGSNEADAFLLVPAIQTSLDKALSLINSLEGQVKLLGGDSVYSDKTTSGYGKQASEGELTIAIPWHRSGCDSENKTDFEARSCELWNNANINWRTATAYDAARVIISALDSVGSSPTPRKLQQEISRNNFSAQGATGMIEFETTGNLQGDRKNSASATVLVKVQPMGENYDFFEIMLS